MEHHSCKDIAQPQEILAILGGQQRVNFKSTQVLGLIYIIVSLYQLHGLRHVPRLMNGFSVTSVPFRRVKVLVDGAAGPSFVC